MRSVQKTRVQLFRLSFSTGGSNRKSQSSFATESASRNSQSKKVESKKPFFDCVRKPDWGFGRKSPFSTDKSDCIGNGRSFTSSIPPPPTSGRSKREGVCRSKQNNRAPLSLLLIVLSPFISASPFPDVTPNPDFISPFFPRRRASNLQRMFVGFDSIVTCFPTQGRLEVSNKHCCCGWLYRL